MDFIPVASDSVEPLPFPGHACRPHGQDQHRAFPFSRAPAFPGSLPGGRPAVPTAPVCSQVSPSAGGESCLVTPSSGLPGLGCLHSSFPRWECACRPQGPSAAPALSPSSRRLSTPFRTPHPLHSTRPSPGRFHHTDRSALAKVTSNVNCRGQGHLSGPFHLVAVRHWTPSLWKLSHRLGSHILLPF